MTSISGQIGDLITLLQSNNSSSVTELQSTSDDFLPKSVTPVHYSISITPDLVKHFKFMGSVSINLKVNQHTNFITLNALDLTFITLEIFENNKLTKIPLKNVSFNTKKERVTIHLNHFLRQGTLVTLKIDYVGILNNNLRGFYKCKYKRSNNLISYLGCTQFEATDARRAFPCWDEPTIKCTFEVELTIPSDLICLSNTTVESRINCGNITIYKFHKTPLMSTYLVAWFIGEYEFIEEYTNRDIRVRIYTPLNKKDSGLFALNIACKCLEFYEEYFNIDYPLSKCDLIGYPQLIAGGMENWGLITFRERCLLTNKSNESDKNKLVNIVMMISHEICHQWFGNLVTINDWSQLWLNEGFACFMQYLSVEKLFKDFDNEIWQSFMVKKYNLVFELDSMSTSHPIECDSSFDVISYYKGCSVIRMLYGYLGYGVFRNSLSKYLNYFKCKHIKNSNDLWKFFSKECSMDVENIMKFWITKKNYPLITCTRDYKNNKVILKQQRYLSTNNNNNKNGSDNIIWQIPMKLKLDGQTDYKTVLFAKQKIEFEISNNCKWIHINGDNYGYYISFYDDNMLNDLIKAVENNNDVLNTNEKICLIRDLTQLSFSGVSQISIKYLLKLLMSFKNENSYYLWFMILDTIEKINHIIDNDKTIKPQFDNIICQLMNTIYNKIKNGLLNNPKQQILQSLIFTNLSKYCYKPVINDGLNTFRNSMKNKKSSLKLYIYDIVGQHGTENDYKLLKNCYLNTKDLIEKKHILKSLAKTENRTLIKQTLNWILDTNDIKLQDKLIPFSLIFKTSNGKEIAFNFLKNTIQKWLKLLNNGYLMKGLFKLPNTFVSFDKANEIEKWYKTLNIQNKNYNLAMKQCIENIRKCAKWRNNSIQFINEWCKLN